MSRRARALSLAFALAAAAPLGCKFGETAIAAGRDQVVVHAVLNPSTLNQNILIEHLLTGRIQSSDSAGSDNDPIRSRGGEPWVGARVVVYGPTGDSVVAVEMSPNGQPGGGTGMYRFVNLDSTPASIPALRVRPGGPYSLRVTTLEGNEVTGATLIPFTAPSSPGGAGQRFNRDRDSVFLFWSSVSYAKRYQVRIDSPRGPYTVFVDSLEYLVSGGLRNPDLDAVPRVFVPGFTQAVAVVAVDTNYFDYYRSANSRFTGSGIVNHLRGGLGVFGSLVGLRFSSLIVDADIDVNKPVEGPWQMDVFAGQATPPFIVPGSVQLYQEGAGAATGSVALSGRYQMQGNSGSSGVLGSMRDGKVKLSFLRSWSASDTVQVLTGTFDGLEIAGTYRGSDVRVSYHKR